MSKETDAWILGTTATLAGFAVGYFTRARDVFRPGPGHVYRIGEMFFADDALVRRIRHVLPHSVVPRPNGGVLLTLAGCYGVFLVPWDAPARLRKQSGRIYQFSASDQNRLHSLIEAWERAGFIQFVGAWSSWPEDTSVAPDEWAPPEGP